MAQLVCLRGTARSDGLCHQAKHMVFLVGSLTRQNAEMQALPSGFYSDNLVINAVAGHYLNMAKAQGIQVDTDIKTEAVLPLKDEDLCVLLTNILENALEACCAAQKKQERYIILKISANKEHLALTCENSTYTPSILQEDDVIPSSKADAQEHGYGIPAIRRIVERYYGLLKLSSHDGCFTVKVSIIVHAAVVRNRKFKIRADRRVSQSRQSSSQILSQTVAVPCGDR